MSIPTEIVQWYEENIIYPTIKKYGVKRGGNIDDINLICEQVREYVGIYVMPSNPWDIGEEASKILHDNKDIIIRTFNEYLTPKDPEMASLLNHAQAYVGLN
jgi:hypothetical protein